MYPRGLFWVRYYFLSISTICRRISTVQCVFSRMIVLFTKKSSHPRMPIFFKKIWRLCLPGRSCGKWNLTQTNVNVLRIPASRSPLITNYKLGDSILQETKTHTYLGVDIQHDLKWNTHINRITASASRTLGFVRRNLSSCNKETKKSRLHSSGSPHSRVLLGCVGSRYKRTHTKSGKDPEKGC